MIEPAAPPEGEGGDAAGPSAGGRYKVVELSTVTDEAIEEALNDWTARGWVLDGMHFAMRESSKRPSMAFLIFSRARAP